MSKGYFYYPNKGYELQNHDNYFALDKTSKLFIRELIDIMILSESPGIIKNDFKKIAKRICFKPHEVKKSIILALKSDIIKFKLETDLEQFSLQLDSNWDQISTRFEGFLCYPPLVKHAKDVANGGKRKNDDRNEGPTQRYNNNDKNSQNTLVHLKNGRFDEFWKLFPRKKAKKNASKLWEKLTEEKKTKAIQKLPNYIYKTEPEFYMLPTTYLKWERWEDED